MKWLLTISITTSLFASTSAVNAVELANDRVTGSVETQQLVTYVSDKPFFSEKPRLTKFEQYQQKLNAERARLLRLAEEKVNNVEKIDSTIKKLKQRIGKTWYVFSGNTPSGWDCSGLVMWAYEQMGVEIPHSADKQGHLGTKVRNPKVGDIVVFGYKGTDSYYHASIYVGNNQVIHAGFRKGTTTQLISLDDPAFKDSTIVFRSILDTP